VTVQGPAVNDLYTEKAFGTQRDRPELKAALRATA
jgi:hypothetical protein